MSKHYSNPLKTYRWKELGLFIIPFIILLLEMTQLLLARLIHSGTLNETSSLSLKNLPTIQGLIPVIGLVVSMVLVNIFLSIFFPKADQMLLPLAGLLSGIGVLMALRTGPDLSPPDPTQGTRQLLWVVLALVTFIATIVFLKNVRWLKQYRYILLVIGILLLLVSVVNAFRIKDFNSPTHDQLNFGPFSLQPSEFLKIILVIVFAGFLSERRDFFGGNELRFGFLHIPVPRINELGPLAIMLGISLLIFLGIRELGLALLIYGIFLCMIYLGSGKLTYVVGGLLIFAVMSYAGYTLLSHFHIFSYVGERFQTITFNIVDWQHWTTADETFAENAGLQIVQGIIALSSGGILGAGLGLGHPTFVPVVQSDMIFTGLGEELGLAGLFGIIAIYLLILYRGYRIAVQTADPFNQLLAAGLTSIFAIETFIIIAANMNFFPLTGLPLPFLSYGGSSLLANYIIIGILMRISHDTALANEREGSE
ncbi:MAG TPA: FtsW/RodA/SpoVE family cell cycle protein [Ktedonobacteraceae bacterium]|nr:FtsW/RodA/SpoVE family cell cycle protein [Ktedonobacteraceae bacterium]